MRSCPCCRRPWEGEVPAGFALAAARRSARVPQKRVATLAGVRPTTISDVERGRHRATPAVLAAYALLVKGGDATAP